MGRSSLDSSMMKKTAADLEATGKKPGSTHGLIGCYRGRGMMLELYSKLLNSSRLEMNVIQVLVSSNYFQSC